MGKRVNTVEARFESFELQSTAQWKSIGERLQSQQQQLEEVLRTVSRHTEDIRETRRQSREQRHLRRRRRPQYLHVLKDQASRTRPTLS